MRPYLYCKYISKKNIQIYRSTSILQHVPCGSFPSVISSFFGNVQVLVCRLSTTLTTDLDVSWEARKPLPGCGCFFFPKDFVASNLCFLGAMDCLWQWEYIMFFFQTVQQKLKWPEKIFTSFPILFPCRGIEKRVGFDKKHPWLWWWGLALNLSFDSHEVPARRYERSKLVKSLRRPVPPLELCRFEWMIAW